MLRGHLDAMTSSGYLEGWAYDDDAPLRPLEVDIVRGDDVLAHGLANRFRWDLADAGCGTGWCAFRLRLQDGAEWPPGGPIALRACAAQAEICRVTGLPVLDDAESAAATLAEVALGDPTTLGAIEQLHGCRDAFRSFIAAAGLEAFVRVGYIYVLGRPADPGGLVVYARHLRERTMTPWEFLKALHDSEEFRSRPRLLATPPEPGFPFRPA